MARNISGIYTLPAGNPVVVGTDIEADWANTTLADLANEITNSLARDGRGGMLAQFKAFAGTQTAPGWSWSLEPRSGIRRAGTGDFRFVIDGVDVASFNAGGLTSASGSVPVLAPGAGPYTLVLAAAGKGIYKDDAADITIPPSTDVAFETGTVVSIFNNNASALDVVRGLGVALYVPGSATDADKQVGAYTFATLWQFATDSWLLINGT